MKRDPRPTTRCACATIYDSQRTMTKAPPTTCIPPATSQDSRLTTCDRPVTRSDRLPTTHKLRWARCDRQATCAWQSPLLLDRAERLQRELRVIGEVRRGAQIAADVA